MNRTTRKTGVLRCTGCGQEILPGEEYWQWNGAVVCGSCFPELARRELEPCREIRGKENYR
ncbi:MAG: hypothetical protein HFF83_04590 [Oscillibacter sp.]|jgi:predicted RNA-binding Zn-ribbon protein involved in translation (DUF1610 family)|nr:hypothetical protein [Oscillibacter sp.]